MSTYTPKPNTWTLFKNTRKTDGSHPDYNGTAMIEMPDGSCVEYLLNAWKRVSKSNVNFIGGFIKPTESKTPTLIDESSDNQEHSWS